jgi:hypothetical protein
MLRNIRKTKHPIRIKGIEGNTVDVTEEGELLGYGTVYYHPQVTANVLSFFNMARRFKSITYNNQEKDAFVVQRDDDTVLEFCPSNEGLYYYDYNLKTSRFS